ncbi:hypothetical protein BSU04_18860 [Caballeronia sordidicola]|uniref:Uncharacterized protein n=1 Tax=Caballeronia sordidicola TaxID=196367 RepID=A0A226X0W7_CABSO|nr:hypothetical protein BSU04_18860 [Caballeronia sordidicola]
MCLAHRHEFAAITQIGISHAEAALSDSIGIPPHLLLPPFDFRCQTCLTANNQR